MIERNIIGSKSEYTKHWDLRSGVTYLNHGSFGPSPRVVRKQRHYWSELLEAEPMDFFLRQCPIEIARVMSHLSALIGTNPRDIVPMENATMGMNVVASSIPLSQGDEVLLTNHEYGAVHRTWDKACKQKGAEVIVAKLPHPLGTSEEIVDTIRAAITPRTRLVVCSHVTSQTAVVLPVREICKLASDLDILSCIDGPHAVAMLPLALSRLNCDYYTASCHKWLSAPFSSGFLYVHPRRQDSIQPAIVSWGLPAAGYESSWRDEFLWLGTRDLAATLAISTAIDFLDGIGWETFRDRSRRLITLALARLKEEFNFQPVVNTPTDYVSMAAVSIKAEYRETLQQRLWDEFQIEIPVTEWNGQHLLRISCHLYNDENDIDALCRAIHTIVT